MKRLYNLIIGIVVILVAIFLIVHTIHVKNFYVLNSLVIIFDIVVGSLNIGLFIKSNRKSKEIRN
jgi:hypothetical protein